MISFSAPCWSCTRHGRCNLLDRRNGKNQGCNANAFSVFLGKKIGWERKTCRRSSNCSIVLLSELYAILLEDILVLLQKQDERLILKFHGKNQASAADAKNIFSPVIKLNTVLVRPVATGGSFTALLTVFVLIYGVLSCNSCVSDNKSFFVLSMSENGAQIYKLTAQSVSDQRT